jgi:acyl-coenzyme A synthetase/AMP-(fatty) acid ligase
VAATYCLKLIDAVEGGMIPERFNLARHCLARPAEITPDKVALIVVGEVAAGMARAERWTYADLDLAVRRVAAGLLAEGLAPGERLLLRLPNNSDYALFFLGAISAGLVPIPISAQLTEIEAAFLLADSEAAAIVQTGTLLHVDSGVCKTLDKNAIPRLKRSTPLPDHADTVAEAPAYIVYTSGTSSRPKGVVHAHRSVLGRIPMHRDWQGLGHGDVMLHAGAFNWSYTLGVGLLDPWSVGATAVLYNGPKDIQVWPKLIRAAGATLFAAVPSLYRQILKYAELPSGDLATLRHCLAAGEAVSPALLTQWRATTGKELYEAFGMSECSTFVSNRPGVPIKPGSPGKPQLGRSIAALPLSGSPEPLPAGEVGLLAIHRSDPGLMLGYWRRPDEETITFRGEWFCGGDLAAFDEDGYLWYHGRVDDIMNAGGYRVSPLEVEAALMDCPGIAEIAIGEYSPRDDVSVIAAWVVRREASAIDADAILAYAAPRLGPYKRPRQIFFVDALPRSANGKLLRRALATLIPARNDA